MLIPPHPGSSRGVSGDGPEGGAGSGSLPPWFVTTAHAGRPDTFGCTGSKNAAVERREAKRPDRKGRGTPRDASRRANGTQRCLASTERRLGAPLPLARGTSE